MDAIFSTAGTAEKEGDALLALGRLPIGVTELAIRYSDVKGGPSITPNNVCLFLKNLYALSSCDGCDGAQPD